MSTPLHIGDVARRSGFSTPTLRYYERIGLLPPPERTASGYRVYPETVLGRLAFIARAKALGCSLDEIATLIPEWDNGACAPVQQRLRTLVAGNAREAEARAGELAAFGARLRSTAAELGRHTPAGACDDDCGCISTAVGVGTHETIDAIACTLEGNDLPGRLEDWDHLLSHVVARQPIDRGVRLELDEGTPIAELARLVEAEAACCRFFGFALTVDGRGLGLEVRAPSEAKSVVEDLFGAY